MEDGQALEDGWRWSNHEARDIMSRVQQADFISWARFYTRRKDCKPQSYDITKVVMSQGC